MGRDTPRSTSSHSTPRSFRMGESAGSTGNLSRKVLASGIESITVPPSRLVIKERLAPGRTFTTTGTGLAAWAPREQIQITPSNAIIRRHLVITLHLHV